MHDMYIAARRAEVMARADAARTAATTGRLRRRRRLRLTPRKPLRWPRLTWIRPIGVGY